MLRLRPRLSDSTGRQGVCKVRFNDGGALQVPSGYVGASNRPGREEAVLSCLPGHGPIASGCSAATTIAAIARTGSRPRRSGIRGPWPPARSPGKELAARPTGRARGSCFDLQRAAHHHRVGCGRIRGGAGARACLAMCRTATARRRCSTISPPGGSLQGRPEGFRRESLPGARRPG